MTTILEEVQQFCGITQGTTAFNSELLGLINSTILTLKELGVVEMTNVTVTSTTEWPTLPYSESVISGIKTVLYMRVRNMFDSTASETIQKARNESYWDSVAAVVLCVDQHNYPTV